VTTGHQNYGPLIALLRGAGLENSRKKETRAILKKGAPGKGGDQIKRDKKKNMKNKKNTRNNVFLGKRGRRSKSHSATPEGYGSW